MKCAGPGCQLEAEITLILKDKITGFMHQQECCIIHTDDYAYMAENCIQCGIKATHIFDYQPVCEAHWHNAFHGLKMRNRYGDEQDGKLTEEVSRMAKKYTVAVSLPQGVKETGFADTVGFFREATRKDGSVVKTKKGMGVYRAALDLTKLRAMIEKHNLAQKDKRTNNDIIWLSMFESDAIPKESAKQSVI